MTDITSTVHKHIQQFKPQIKASYKTRLHTSDIPTAQSYFLKETCSLHFQLIEADRKLKTLSSLTKQTSLFNNQNQQIQTLTEKIQDSIKVCQIKLEELQKDQMQGQHVETIKEILNQRLLELSKQFQSLLQTRTQKLRQNEAKKSQLGFTSQLEVSSREVPSFLERYSINRARCRSKKTKWSPAWGT